MSRASVDLALLRRSGERLTPAGGVRRQPPPARSPNLHAYAERFVRTIKESCVEPMILFGEGAVRKATAEFMAHYHSELSIPYWASLDRQDEVAGAMRAPRQSRSLRDE